jgi:hypothetical protein
VLALVRVAQAALRARSEQKREGTQPSVLYQEVEEAGMAAALLSELISPFLADLEATGGVALVKQLLLAELLGLVSQALRQHLACMDWSN